jgi:hypothetical protein
MLILVNRRFYIISFLFPEQGGFLQRQDILMYGQCDPANAGHGGLPCKYPAALLKLLPQYQMFPYLLLNSSLVLINNDIFFD